MKIGGIDPKTLPVDETLVLPRGDAMLVFKARGLADMEDFNKLCPEPTPPGKLTRDGWVPNADDPAFQQIQAEYMKRRLAFMVVKSLEPTEIEWETVNLSHPGTWANWETDLKHAGLTQVEINRIVGLVLEANCLDEQKLKRARESFLRGPQVASVESCSLTTEPDSTPSGAPVAA